jgi:hypothetical protein
MKPKADHLRTRLDVTAALKHYLVRYLISPHHLAPRETEHYRVRCRSASYESLREDDLKRLGGLKEIAFGMSDRQSSIQLSIFPGDGV